MRHLSDPADAIVHLRGAIPSHMHTKGELIRHFMGLYFAHRFSSLVLAQQPV